MENMSILSTKDMVVNIDVIYSCHLNLPNNFLIPIIVDYGMANDDAMRGNREWGYIPVLKPFNFM